MPNTTSFSHVHPTVLLYALLNPEDNTAAGSYDTASLDSIHFVTNKA